MEEEKILGMIPKAQVKPGLTDYNLFITNTRIIGGKVGSSGLAGIAGGAVGHIISRALQDPNKYKDMNPNDVLNSHKKNFAWNFDTDIEAIKLIEGFITSKIKIKFSPLLGAKKKTIFFSEKYYDETKDILQHVVASKMIIK